MQTPIQFIFVGRLVTEKGFDLIIDALTELASSSYADRFHVHIFGDGTLKDALPVVDCVTYHGRQDKKIVEQTWKRCHYTLMPSRFLETFGLTALDSLACSVPVLAPDKGGLSQFIIDDRYILDLQSSLAQQIMTWIDIHDDHERQRFSALASQTAEKYSAKQWVERFQAYSGLAPGATILLVSDYIVEVGGIESYLLHTQQLLEDAGYTVHLIGCDDIHKATHRSRQLLGTLRNTKAQAIVQQAISNHDPDLIWRHSLQRRLGPAPLRSQLKSKRPQRVMYHDVGLFHPYPSAVTDMTQLARARSFWGYLREGWRVSPLRLPLALAKRCSSKLLQMLLARQIVLHLVPSPYLVDIVEENFSTPVKVDVLPHFLSA